MPATSELVWSKLADSVAPTYVDTLEISIVTLAIQSEDYVKVSFCPIEAYTILCSLKISIT